MDAFAALRPWIGRAPAVTRITEKYCTACGELKALTEFYLRGRLRADGSRGPSSHCKTCDKVRISRHRSAKRKAAREARCG